MYGSIHRGENSKKQQKHERRLEKYSNREFVLITTSRGKSRQDTVKKMRRNGVDGTGWFTFTNKLPRVWMAYEVLSG